MEVKLVEITPQMAKNWLGNNFNNRNLSKRRVHDYVRQINKGQWQINGETIKISKDDTLLDGQHRLQAVVNSNKSIKSFVAYGADKEAFKTIDTGKSRGASDILSIAGYTNPIVLAAAVRAYKRYEKDAVQDSEYCKLTNTEVLNFVEKTPKFGQSVQKAAKYQKINKLITPSMCALLYYVLSSSHASHAANFFNKLDSGDNLAKNDPIFVLRERLIERSGIGEVSRREAWVPIWLAITTWNAFKKGETYESIRLPSTFDSYPEVK